MTRVTSSNEISRCCISSNSPIISLIGISSSLLNVDRLRRIIYIHISARNGEWQEKYRTKFTAGDIFFRRDFRLSTMVSRKMVGIIMYNLYCHDATFTSEPTTPEVIDRDDHKRYSNNIYLYIHTGLGL